MNICKMLQDSVLYTNLKASLEEERKDADKYKELAEIACNSGYEEAKKILCDIRRDEQSHARAIEHILEKYS